jgi:hypothetical protein
MNNMTKMIIENAAAYPILKYVNAALYTQLTRICVVSDGSPLLLTSQTTLKLLKVQITPRIMAGIMIGFNNGMVICLNFDQAPAPSISAAS